MNSRYSYEELFDLIRKQMEKEKREKEARGIVEPQPTTMDRFLNEGLRAINNPTTQNLTNAMNVLINPAETTKIEPENRLNYIYRSS